MKKRLLSLLLALAVCLSLACLPGNYAWADEGEIIESEAEENVAEGQLPEEPEESPEPLPEDSVEAEAAETVETEVSEEAMLSAEPAEETVTEAAETETYSTESGADNDEMFAGFVNSMFYRTRGGNHDTGNRLEGLDSSIYWLLYNDIVSVSHGNYSSTSFVISVEDLGLGDSYTAEDLGVSELFYYNEETQNYNFSQDALNAMYAKIDFDFGLIIGALLADCPYDLYWFDKTVGVDPDSEIYIYGNLDGLRFSNADGSSPGFYTFHFAVAQGYAIDTYQVDTSIPELVQTAVTNAQAIASNYSSYADEAKLSLYKDEICSLVSYDDEAADPSNNTPYGDPWQLIWVFDGDPDSNVVCEGYAKAFQYLCDISSFSGNICCYQISGTMHGGTGAGRHMWNIVKTDSGKNYLVDVTNCDDATIGWPDLLFLREPVSGSISDGYTFSCNSSSIDYTYGERMFELYSRDQLALLEESFPVARNNNTGEEYADVSDAIMAAGSGETVELLEDCSDDFVMVTVGRTLDLNGKTLTTEYLSAFNSSNVTDSSDHAGLLACSNVTLNVNNSQMPIKTESGYKLFTITAWQRYGKRTNNTDHLHMQTRPYLGTALDHALNNTYLGSGSTAAGIIIEAKLTYKNTQGSFSNTNFVYNDDHCKQVYDGVGASAFYVDFTGMDKLTEVSLTTVITSKTTGVVWTPSAEYTLVFPRP